MRTLTIQIETKLEDDLAQFCKNAKRGMESLQYQGEVLSFATADLFFSELTHNRWKILEILLGAGVTGVRALARQLGRDVRRVHDDAAALVKLGLLEKTQTGALCCPYECIHFDITMRAFTPMATSYTQPTPCPTVPHK